MSGAQKAAFVVRLILAGAVVSPSVGSAAENDATSIKSIILSGRMIDRVRTIKQKNWTIGFAPGGSFATSSERGMTLHGLRCANVNGGAVDCHIFMAMRPVESRAHFCQIAPDDRRASDSWKLYIDCPSEIKFGQ